MYVCMYVSSVALKARSRKKQDICLIYTMPGRTQDKDQKSRTYPAKSGRLVTLDPYQHIYFPFLLSTVQKTQFLDLVEKWLYPLYRPGTCEAKTC